MKQPHLNVQLFVGHNTSPEQVRGDPITTSSDVYSLGVLLYELLTGVKPYRLAERTPAEMERVICYEEPERPSVVARSVPGRALRGDLDNIVLMAMRKEPQRRYTSAEQLSDDIDRHLANVPIFARPDTRGYRAWKFIQRNKPWVAAAVLIFVSLALGIAVSLWQAQAARKQRDLARLEQAKAARINAFLQEMVGYSGVGGAAPNHRHDATVAEMLDNAAQRVETELNDQPEVKAEMLGTIGGTYLSQAKYAISERYLREAFDLDIQLYGPFARQAAAVMYTLGSLSYLKGESTVADSWFQKALPIYRRHANDADFEIRLLVAILSDAAFVKRALGQFDQAEALWREALTYGPRLPPKYRGQSIAPKTFLAQLYMDRGDTEKADPLASEASEQLRAFGGDRFSLAQSLIDLGNVRRLENRYTKAEPLIQEGIQLYSQAQGSSHPNVAYGLLSLATLHYYQGKYVLAEQDASEAQRIVQQLPKGTNYHAVADIVRGRILTKTGRAREAEPLLREGLAIQRESARRTDATLALGILGECLIAQKRYAEAEPLLVESYQTLKRVHVPESPLIREARERLEVLYGAWGKSANFPP
jgi:serine/threonine-protein kinase